MHFTSLGLLALSLAPRALAIGNCEGKAVQSACKKNDLLYGSIGVYSSCSFLHTTTYTFNADGKQAPQIIPRPEWIAASR